MKTSLFLNVQKYEFMIIHYSGEELNTPVVSVIFPTDSSDSTTSTTSKFGYK